MSDPRDDAGVTLIELMIAIVILGLIMVPLTGAIITGLRTTTESQKRLSESRSPLFTSAYFADDAQSADVNGITIGGSPVCEPGSGTNVVSFAWNESGTQYSSSYVISGAGANTVLKRSYCRDGAPETIVAAPVLGDNLTCLDGTQQPVCASVANDATGHPRIVTLTATTPNNENGFFTLTATRRAT
jgi:prepilin-type N-terminal cleavage/methylation domain-containing protein